MFCGWGTPMGLCAGSLALRGRGFLASSGLVLDPSPNPQQHPGFSSCGWAGAGVGGLCQAPGAGRCIVPCVPGPGALRSPPTLCDGCWPAPLPVSRWNLPVVGLPHTLLGVGWQGRPVPKSHCPPSQLQRKAIAQRHRLGLSKTQGIVWKPFLCGLFGGCP